MKFSSLLLLALVVAFQINAAEYDLGVHGTLSLDASSEWKISSRAAERPDGTTIGYSLLIQPTGKAHASCLLTLAYVTNKFTPAELRERLLKACDAFVDSSVEKTKNLKEFALKHGYGAYCAFTDASLVGKPPQTGDEYKVMASGMIQLDSDALVVVSIVYDDPDGPEFKSLLQAVNSLEIKMRKGS